MPDRSAAARSRAAASPGIRRPAESVRFTYEGETVEATAGTSVASALLEAGFLSCREAPDGPRGVFCGMGVCFDCLVVVDGVPNTRACMTWVRDGMDIARQDGAGRATEGNPHERSRQA
jgi:D-hydroxyproline dehydrogenase subunit gamma